MTLQLDKLRLDVSKNTAAARKAQFGQYLTSSSIATYMSSLFNPSNADECHLLDAGAGIGSLTAAYLERVRAGELTFRKVSVDAFELDERLHPYLKQTLVGFEDLRQFNGSVRGVDFVHEAANSICGDLFSQALPQYTHAILNPPYKKIRSNSAYRESLRRAGIETVNLYSGFVALALSLLAPGGQLVAIVPRSFCNGPYYKPFREFLLKHAAIRHIHLFYSRDKAFATDDVLQENVIIGLVRDKTQGRVTVSTSSDDRFHDVETHHYEFDQIVFPNDREKFIHVPTSHKAGALDSVVGNQHALEEIGVKVSTGPVVDFRLKEYLVKMPGAGDIPLLYPGHFRDGVTQWPNPDLGKPNGIQRNTHTEKWLYPSGYYCVVRRFSAKEERRRVVASVVCPESFSGAPVLGFENHLNVFHEAKRGLPKELSYGIAAYLNTTAVDEALRRFSGHTQVNATDLRSIKYPSRETLLALGVSAIACGDWSQESIDAQFERIVA